MRYLGMALGMSVALGFAPSSARSFHQFSTGELGGIAATSGGRVVLGGVALCVLGILVAGYAGLRKERELPSTGTADNLSGDGEFKPVIGLVVAFVSGLMSACFAFGIQSGTPIAAAAVAAGTNPLFQNNAVLCVILPGGFLTNTIWCLVLTRATAPSPLTRSQRPRRRPFASSPSAGWRA